MKKLIFLPAVLAAFSFAMIPGNAAIQANAEEAASLTLNLSEMAKAVDNTTSVDDVNAGLVTYGYRGGNPETATYTTFAHPDGDPNDGNITTSNCLIDWGGARFVVNSDYIIAYMTAHQDLTLTIAGAPGGWVQNNYLKYFIADSTFDLANPTALVADYAYRPADNTLPAIAVAKTYNLYEGETYMFAYGIANGEGCNLQSIVNITFTFTTGIAASAEETYDIEDLYCKPGWTGSDMSSALANYGVRFGTNTEVNPYNVAYTHSGDGKYTVNGNVVEWWQISLTADTGFAFSVTANKRITVTSTFSNLTSAANYGWLANTSIHFDIYRNNTLLKNVYSYENTDNLTNDIPKYNSVGAVELLPGDVLYVGFTFNPGTTGNRNIQLQNYDNFTVKFNEVLTSRAVTNFVNDWLSLRNSNNLNLCNLSAEDQVKLDTLIEKYNGLNTNEKAIVDKTIDVKGYTIADSVSYFASVASNANNKLNSILSNNANIYVVIAVAGVAMLLVVLTIYKKRTNK